MIFRVSKFSLFILSGFMAIIISMPSAHAVLTKADNVSENFIPTLSVNPVCDPDVAVTSDGVTAATASNAQERALTTYCLEAPLPTGYEITYEFNNTTRHQKMDSITIWSNGGYLYDDGELRSFKLEVDYLAIDYSTTPSTTTAATLVMNNASISITNYPIDSRTVYFKDTSGNPIVLFGVSEVRISNLVGVSNRLDLPAPNPQFRELQLNVEDIDNKLVTRFTLSAGSSTPGVAANSTVTIGYWVTVINSGVDDAHEVSLVSNLPSAITPTQYNGTIMSSGAYDQLTGEWSGISIPAGQFKVLFLQGTITSAQIGQTITGSTTAADNLENDETVTTGDVLSHTIIPAVPDVKITIENITAPHPDLEAGETISYTYKVKNTGNVPLTNVVVNIIEHGGSGPKPVPVFLGGSLADAYPSGDSSGTAGNALYASLASGDEVTFTGTYLVTQTDFDTLQ